MEFGERFWKAVLCPVLLVLGAVVFIILFLVVFLIAWRMG